tara:strand:+ start:9058 stop:9357 length:300 start_codon:yes stop_codon:yes gene_type:complete
MSPFVGCCHPPAAWGIEAIPRFVEVSEGLLVVDEESQTFSIRLAASLTTGQSLMNAASSSVRPAERLKPVRGGLFPGIPRKFLGQWNEEFEWRTLTQRP